MARASAELIEALRQTARRLAKSPDYQWGHMGSCNCGHLAQTITHKTAAEIHRLAMERYGDWGQQVQDFCPQSGLPIDYVIEEMLVLGLNKTDLAQLEKLSSLKVQQALPQHKKYLKHNIREDVVLYLQTWAKLLEDELVSKIQAPEYRKVTVKEPVN